VGAAGSATYSGGVFTVKGSGSDIALLSDGFHFAYQAMSGDGQIVARVATQQNTDPWAKSGVMIRESLSASSTHAMVVLTPSNGIHFQWRPTTGGGSSSRPGAAVSAPYWVKLVRSGSTFTGYQSSDGSNWALVFSTNISMASNVLVGLAVTSHNNGALSTASFEGVAVVP